MGQPEQQQCPAVGHEIELLRFSPPEFELVFDTLAEAMAANAAVEQFISRTARTNFPLHLLPL